MRPNGRSVTKCYIDATDRATDAYGNAPTFVEVMQSSTQDVWAWTAAAGTSYDNDIHATGASKITVIAT